MKFLIRWNSRAFIAAMDCQMENFCTNLAGWREFIFKIFFKLLSICLQILFFDCSRSAIVFKNKRNNATPQPSEWWIRNRICNMVFIKFIKRIVDWNFKRKWVEKEKKRRGGRKKLHVTGMCLIRILSLF